jgi:phage/plasmid-associated DNA primase
MPIHYHIITLINFCKERCLKQEKLETMTTKTTFSCSETKKLTSFLHIIGLEVTFYNHYSKWHSKEGFK